MYQNFIGIDIGKHSFYSFVYGAKKAKEYPNHLTGFKRFCTDHKKLLSNGLVVLETTGGYEMALINHLQTKPCVIHRANTRKVKHFIRSYGQLGKSDAIDAEGLSRYGYERQSTLKPFTNPPNKTLLKLVQRRIELKKILVQEKNRLTAPDNMEMQNSFKKIIRVIEKELNLICVKIKKIISDNTELKEIKKVLETVPGIGDSTSSDLLALLPELGHLDRKKIASLAGVAPHPNESGQRQGHRFVRGGRFEVKPVLFMAAMAAGRSKSELGEFYRRLIQAGKKKMVALVAVMRKIVVIANARVRDYLNTLGECSA